MPDISQLTGADAQAIGDLSWRIANASASRTLKSRFTLQVEDFGTVGTPDDSAIFTAALAEASAIGSSLIQSSLAPTVNIALTPGQTYNVANVVVPSFAGLTTLGASEGLPGAVLNVLSGATFGVGNTGAVTGCAVNNIYFKGPGSAVDCKGVYFANLSRGRIARNYFDQFGLHAIHMPAGVGVYITDNIAQNCLIHRASIVAKTGVLHFAGTDHFVLRNEMTPSLLARSSASLFFCGILGQGANHNFEHNKGELADVGVRWEADLSRVLANNGELCFGPGYENSGSSQYVGNTAYNNSQHANGAYSAFVNTCNTGQFSGNVAASAVANAHKYGFEDTISSDTTKNTYDVTNQSYGHTLQTYKLAAFAGSAVQTPGGQAKTFVALATTPPVDNYKAFITNNASAITITNFTLGFPGQELMIVFSDANTSIGNGAGITTPTGATVGPFNANEVQHFVNVNGTWFFSSKNP